MPDEANPSYAAWKEAISEAMAGLDDGAIVVGHSVGGTILIITLAAAPPKQKSAEYCWSRLRLSARAAGRRETSGRQWPTSARGCLPKTPVHLYHGSADETAPLAHVDLYARRRYPARPSIASMA